MKIDNCENKIILGIAGELLAGKSTASDFYINHFNAQRLKFSQLLDEILTVLNLPLNRFNEQEMAVCLKSLFGDKVLAYALAQSAKKSSKEFILFDGIRQPEEAITLKKILPEFKFIYIQTSLEIRYQRMLKRFEKPEDSTQTFEEFKNSQTHKADIQISELKQLADYVVNNDSTLEDFKTQLTKIAVAVGDCTNE
jgi:dephospho-CoA kinase